MMLETGVWHPISRWDELKSFAAPGDAYMDILFDKNCVLLILGADQEQIFVPETFAKLDDKPERMLIASPFVSIDCEEYAAGGNPPILSSILSKYLPGGGHPKENVWQDQEVLGFCWEHLSFSPPGWFMLVQLPDMPVDTRPEREHTTSSVT